MDASTQLLIIDPQNDFCDIPPAHRPPGCSPALPVAGADGDMHRVARLVTEAGASFSRITVTLDTHQRLDIAHPGYWHTGERGPVAPFTSITAEQVRSGEFQPRDPSALARTLAYLDALQARQRYTLMVWPEHCIAGTWGHAVHASLGSALQRWKRDTGRAVAWLRKGQNPGTEHYSAVEAEVPDPADPATGTNHALLAALDQASTLVIAGEAGSHCVRATTEHLVEYLPGGHPERLVLLEDGMSPVTGHAALQLAFFESMRAHGVALLTAAELQARLN